MSKLSRIEVVRRIAIMRLMKVGESWPDFLQDDPHGSNWGQPLAEGKGTPIAVSLH
jgi:hypothetical protein